MRSFGWGKHSIEEKMADERDEMLQVFQETAGKPFNPSSTINTSVMNIICSLLFGKRFKHEDPKIQNLISDLNIFISFAVMDFEWGYVPYISSFIPGNRHYRKLIAEPWTRIQDFIEEEIIIRRERMKDGLIDEPKDFLEGYLKELGSTEDGNRKISQNWLLGIGGDFFIAGSETTTTTLRWALVYMLNFPHVQRKIQEELDSVIGKPTGKGMVGLSDRSRLPYTDAAIMEIQRLSAIVATALTHSTTTDVNIRGYSIPKGTEVHPSLFAWLLAYIYITLGDFFACNCEVSCEVSCFGNTVISFFY